MHGYDLIDAGGQRHDLPSHKLIVNQKVLVGEINVGSDADVVPRLIDNAKQRHLLNDSVYW